MPGAAFHVLPLLQRHGRFRLLVFACPIAASELAVHPRQCLTAMCSKDNADVLAGTAVELLRALVDEADDLPQAQLDILLIRLLPAHAAEAPASHAATRALLQRSETTVQPYLQRLLSGLLTGARTDSELRGDYHSVFYAVGGNGIVAAHWHVMGLQIVAAMMLLTFWPCWCTRVDGLVCWAVRFLN